MDCNHCHGNEAGLPDGRQGVTPKSCLQTKNVIVEEVPRKKDKGTSESDRWHGQRCAVPSVVKT